MNTDKELMPHLPSRLIRIEWPNETMVAIYKKKSPKERIKIASGMWDSARLQITAILHSQHPDWNEEMIKKEVVKRLSHENTGDNK